MARLIEFADQLPSEKLVVMIPGFSEFVHHGWPGLYYNQIQDLIGRGYDVLILPLPGNNCSSSLSFCDPVSIPEKLRKSLWDIYEANGCQKFKVVAFSAAGAALTHCWAEHGETFLSGVVLVSPAFDFKPRIVRRLTLALLIYYSGILGILGLAYFSLSFLILLPILYVAFRLIRIPKDKLRSNQVNLFEKKPYYPLLASAKLLLMQRKVKKAVKRHALWNLPTLLIAGESDPIVDFRYAEKLFTKDLRASTVIIHEGDHSILLTQWEHYDLRRAWDVFFSK